MGITSNFMRKLFEMALLGENLHFHTSSYCFSGAHRNQWGISVSARWTDQGIGGVWHFSDWCLNNIKKNYIEMQAIHKGAQMVFHDCYRDISSPNREHIPSAPARAVRARQGWKWIGRAVAAGRIGHNVGFFLWGVSKPLNRKNQLISGCCKHGLD